MAVFEIRTAGQLLQKLIEEESDFAQSGHLSQRHALNAIMTAHHLWEWVWGDFAKGRHDLHVKWKITPRDHKGFQKFLVRRCPELTDAEQITNGAKHFRVAPPSGLHEGAFDEGFSKEFDVSFLWIERQGKREEAEDFVRKLVTFWTIFFDENAIPR